MKDLWRWLLNLDRLPPDAQNMALGWERPLPGWVWVLAIVLLGLYALWSYSGLIGNRRGRGAMALARAGLLLLLVALVAGPAIVVPRELIERDWVVYLLDRSRSMSISDLPGRISRDEQLRRLLSASPGVLDAVAADHETLWLGFDEGAYDLEPSGPAGPPRLEAPQGRRTLLAASLDQVLRRLSARPVNSIVLFTDGQTPQPATRAVLRQLEANAVPIIVVPLGSGEAVRDLAVGRVESPTRAFAHDIVPIDVTIDRLGDGRDGAAAEVRLVDALTGEVYDSETLGPGDERDRVTLLARPRLAGPATWRVVIESAGLDLIEGNNEREFDIDLVDRPLKVLYVEARPRWEYRWIKDMTIRERTIDSSVMLLSADRDFAQEGNTPITRLPNSPEEWEPYDVIVLGDVHADFFSAAQQDMIRAHVSERGAGLLFIAGARANPSAFADSPLSALLPMRGNLNLPLVGEPVRMQPTDTAHRLSVLQLMLGDRDAWEVLTDPSQPWADLQWALRLDRRALKPAVEVLATTAQPFDGGEPLPLVTFMRFGAGQSVFVATDETWRWRYGLGDLLQEQFWNQLIRMLGRDRLTLSGRPATLTVNPRRAEVGQPIVIELRLLDAELAQRAISEIPVELVDPADGSVVALSLSAVDDTLTRYEAAYVPDRAGNLDVRIVDPALARFDLGQRIEVARPEDEMRRPDADHELLRTLAEETGGQVIDPAAGGQAAPLEALRDLPNRSIRTPMDLVEPLWDTPLCLILVVLLLTTEWIGRKMLRLN
ncbi:MAG: VWA domain-containing protein [Phycisphaerales bacterium]|nr:VWA domain-containing protein [Phycisphaerales bacterium]